jgi:peptide/nickel transport system substrate-binding protein
VVAVNDPLDGQDPYDQSNSNLYAFWCEVAGCLVAWDAKKGEPIPDLAESWHVESPTAWVFNLRRNVRWQDGTPFTAADVVHSIQRVGDHPKAKQKDRVRNIARVEAIDDYTVRVITREPDAELLDSVFVVGIAMTSKAQFDRGADLGKEPALGTGPYALKEWIPNERAVVVKVPNWWGGPVQGPEEVVYRSMREDEVRVTALLNNEVQIAQIPPQMVERVRGASNARVVVGDPSHEFMFLGMNQNFKPWDNKPLRQAVGYAIDRDAIIQGILGGYASRLDGPIGPVQYGYTPDLQPKYTYNPERARQLVAQAGYPSGLDVEFATSAGRYTMDKQISEAIVQMLTAVGIRTRLLTPEYSSYWANILEGKVPFYYQQRGSIRDPGRPLSQYFETGVTKRIGYSNAELDALFAKERAAFEPSERKKLLAEIMSVVLEEAPAHFLWSHKLIWGVANSVEWTPRFDDSIYAQDIRPRPAPR